MTFSVGQTVVCIDAKGCEPFLRNGQTYVVESIVSIWLRLVGVAEQFKPLHGFNQRRFRPVQERKKETDISVFNKILDDVSRKAPASVLITQKTEQ